MKTLLTFLMAITLGSLAFASEENKDFDSNEDVRFESVSVPVGAVQTAQDLKAGTDSAIKAKTISRKYFDKTVAIGLSPNEMKNLNVDSGALLEIQAGGREVKASVYRVTGAVSPDHGTINLSPAAAAKLQVKSGDLVVVHHLEDTSLPNMVDKPSVVEFSTRGDQQSNL